MINALLKLLGLGVRVAPVVKDILTSAPSSTTGAPLSHADSERQAAAARAAGPRCDSNFMGVRCARTRGHGGLHESSDGSGWDDDAVAETHERCSSFLLDRIGPREAVEPVVYRCTLDEGHAGQHLTPHGRRWPPP